MSDEVKNVAPAEAPIKKKRRGISNETKAVSQLKFHDKDASENGLFVGHLEEVTLNWSVAKEGSSFAGLKIPYLTFNFASQHANPAEQRHVYNTLFPIPSNIATIPGGESEWQVKNLMNWLKHMLDVFYLKGTRLLTEEEIDALSLPFYDYDEDTNEYIQVEPQEVINGYETLFTNFLSIFNGTFNLKEGETPKPVYKDANGKPFVLWIKLLRHRKTKKGWINVTQNGDLGFDSFIGNGVIELHKGTGTKPLILRIDPSKESITPKDTKKEPNLMGQNMPPNWAGVVVNNMPTGIPSGNEAFMAAGTDEMPF